MRKKKSPDLPGVTTEEEKEIKARNTRNRREGGIFEKMILAACEDYRARGVAEIAKVPEARRVVGRTGNRSSLMICANAEKAHPDFMGSLAPEGKCVVFDAKHTENGKITANVVSDKQDEILRRHMACGASCYIAVSFGFADFFLVPYSLWIDMKARVGRKYLRPDDEAIQSFRFEAEDILGEDGEPVKDKSGEVRKIAWFLGKN